MYAIAKDKKSQVKNNSQAHTYTHIYLFFATDDALFIYSRQK